MPHSLELARFRVRPDQMDALLATRDEAIGAVARACPGLVSAQLAHLGDGEWIDAVVWASREQALAAAEQVMSIPEFARWCTHIAEVVSMEHADIHSTTHATPLSV